MRLLPMGPCAVLLEDLPAEPAEWSEALRGLAPAGVVDIVPAGRTVLVRCATPEALADAVAAFDAVTDLASPARDPSATVTIPVAYDGDDLAAVAGATGLTPDEVIERHAGVVYRVAFCGFAPGFAYLTGLPPELHLPRLATPRTRVPAGAVAIASAYSAVYPTASPGGWHLLGSTDVVLFDPDRSPPALLAPATLVRFVPR